MQHRKTLMLVLTALFAALTAIGAFFKIPFALAAISLQFLFTAIAGILLNAILPGNDYEFGISGDGDKSADLGSY